MPSNLNELIIFQKYILKLMLMALNKPYPIDKLFEDTNVLLLQFM